MPGDESTGRGSVGVPVAMREGVPLYRAGQAPEHLRSKTWLGAFPRRLKLAPGQLPLAWVDTRDFGEVALYDPAQAVKMRPLPSRTRERLEREHTCPVCGLLKGYRVRERCQECQEVQHLAWERAERRTCRKCRTLRQRPYPQGSERLCRVCRAARSARRREDAAAMLLCSGQGCTTVVASMAAVRRHQRQYPYAGRWYRLCAQCETRIDMPSAVIRPVPELEAV